LSATIFFFSRYTRALTCQRLSLGGACKDYVGDSNCTIDVNGGSPDIFTEYWALFPMSSKVKMTHHLGVCVCVCVHAHTDILTRGAVSCAYVEHVAK